MRNQLNEKEMREVLYKALEVFTGGGSVEDAMKANQGYIKKIILKAINEIIYTGSIPSLNHMYATSRYGKRRVSERHRQFKQDIAKLAMINRVKKIEGKAELNIYANFMRKGRDISNIIKPIEDALKGIMYNDDRQIYKGVQVKNESKDHGEYLVVKGSEL